jgi:hypothetical protein
MSIPRLNWTHIKALSDLTYHQLPEVSKILKIPHLVPHTTYTVWILIGVIVVIILGAAGVYVYFKWGRKYLLRWIQKRPNKTRDSRASYKSKETKVETNCMPNPTAPESVEMLDREAKVEEPATVVLQIGPEGQVYPVLYPREDLSKVITENETVF